MPGGDGSRKSLWKSLWRRGSMPAWIRPTTEGEFWTLLVLYERLTRRFLQRQERLQRRRNRLSPSRRAPLLSKLLTSGSLGSERTSGALVGPPRQTSECLFLLSLHQKAMYSHPHTSCHLYSSSGTTSKLKHMYMIYTTLHADQAPPPRHTLLYGYGIRIDQRRMLYYGRHGLQSPEMFERVWEV